MTVGIKINQQDIGDGEVIVAPYTGPAAYTNPGGDPVAASDFGFRVGSRLDAVECPAPTNSTRYAVFERDATDAHLGVFRWFEETGVEVANAVDLSGITIDVTARGR